MSNEILSGIMHPKMIDWLNTFLADCHSKTPMHIYDSLLQLGIARPGITYSPDPKDGSGCDCEKAIKESGEWIARCLEDLKMPGSSVEYIQSKRQSIKDHQADIVEFTWMHQNHGLFNKTAHDMLKSSGKLRKVRAACLRDNRGGVKYIEYGVEYSGHACRPFGLDLATFLVDNPQGWW